MNERIEEKIKMLKESRRVEREIYKKSFSYSKQIESLSNLKALGFAIEVLELLVK